MNRPLPHEPLCRPAWHAGRKQRFHCNLHRCLERMHAYVATATQYGEKLCRMCEAGSRPPQGLANSSCLQDQPSCWALHDAGWRCLITFMGGAFLPRKQGPVAGMPRAVMHSMHGMRGLPGHRCPCPGLHRCVQSCHVPGFSALGTCMCKCADSCVCHVVKSNELHTLAVLDCSWLLQCRPYKGSCWDACSAWSLYDSMTIDDTPGSVNACYDSTSTCPCPATSSE